MDSVHCLVLWKNTALASDWDKLFLYEPAEEASLHYLTWGRNKIETSWSFRILDDGQV
jgi:hypothetical protein